jgi:hypothetical protein
MEIISVDSWSIIGRQHFSQGEISQDYAMTKLLSPNSMIALISDGCSGANANTDIGSRTLVWSFYNWFINNQNNKENYLGFLENFKKSMYTDDYNDYIATLGVLWNEGNKFTSLFFGDGEILIKYKSGIIETIQIEYENNMPFYPLYLLNKNMNEFVHKFKAELKISRYNNGILESESNLDINSSDITNGIKMSFDAENIEAIFITTDGISQLYGINKIDLVNDIFQFKTYNGAFLKRKMLNINKKYLKENKGWLDDFSIAGLICGEPYE